MIGQNEPLRAGARLERTPHPPWWDIDDMVAFG